MVPWLSSMSNFMSSSIERSSLHLRMESLGNLEDLKTRNGTPIVMYLPELCSLFIVIKVICNSCQIARQAIPF